MPTTITSAGITFNDASTLTSANIGTAQLVNGSVTAAKLGTNEQKQIAKAWVNFNGTTSPGTIRSSYNVSSVTKNGTGDYTVNFATAMANSNYVMNASSSTSSISTVLATISSYDYTVPRTVNNIRIQSMYVNANNNKTLFDDEFSNVAIFGN